MHMIVAIHAHKKDSRSQIALLDVRAESEGVEFGRSDTIRVGTGEDTGRVIEVGVTRSEDSTARSIYGIWMITDYTQDCCQSIMK